MLFRPEAEDAAACPAPVLQENTWRYLPMKKVQVENKGDYKLGSDVEKDELEKLIDELLKEEK